MAEHLETCLPAIPDQVGCAAVRELYGGSCPDHDPLCDAECPVGDNQEG
jgi:hypothetical protein